MPSDTDDVPDELAARRVKLRADAMPPPMPKPKHGFHAWVTGDGFVDFTAREGEKVWRFRDTASARQAAHQLLAAASQLDRARLKAEGKCVTCGKLVAECRGHMAQNGQAIHLAAQVPADTPFCGSAVTHRPRLVAAWDNVTCKRCLSRRPRVVDHTEEP